MALVSNLVARFTAETSSFERGTSRCRQSLSGFSRQLLGLVGIGGGLYGLKRGLEAAVGAAMEQEKAQMDLVAALGGTDAAIGQVRSQFGPFSESMQKLTVYSDEQVLSQMAYARNLGVTTNRLEESAKAAIGLAARYRIDLSAAMMLVGRASQGQTQMLTRYGIVMDQSLSSQEKFNELLKIGVNSFKLAEAETKTATGALQQMRNQVNELQEAFGTALLPAITAASQAISQHIRENQSELQKFITSQIEGLQAIWEAYSWLYDKIAEKGPIGGPMGSQIPAAGGLETWKYSYGTYGLTKVPDIHSMDMFLQQTEALRQTQEDYNAEFDQWFRGADQMDDLDQEWDFLVEHAMDYSRTLEEASAQQQYMNDLVVAATEAEEKRYQTAQAVIEETARRMKWLTDEATEIKTIGEIGLEAAITFKRGFGEAFADVIMRISTVKDAFRSLALVVMRSVLVNVGTNIAAGMMGAKVAHAGGIIGETSFPMRMLPAWAFEEAPRLHGGLMPDEFPAILQRGEMVTPRGAGQDVTVNIVSKSGAPLPAEGQARIDGRQMIIDIVVDDYYRHGRTYGLR